MKQTVLALTLVFTACSSTPPYLAPADVTTTDTTRTDIAVDIDDGPDACWRAQMSGAPRPCTCFDGRAGNLYGCDPPRCQCTGDAGVDVADVAVTEASFDAPADVIDECPPRGSVCFCSDGGTGRTVGGCDPPGCDCSDAGVADVASDTVPSPDANDGG